VRLRRCGSIARTIEAEEVLVSTVSLWEIALKRALGTMPVGALEAHEAAGASGYRPLAPAPAHVLFLAELPVRREHRDPFSRMLAAQARREGLTLTTEDPRLGAHGVPVVGRG
jgi:PIN domain nuclease of toxin-antitoxin system